MSKKLEDLIKENMQKAFWDKLENDMKEENYEMLLGVLEDIKNRLINIIPNRIDLHKEFHETIDTKLIEQMLSHKAVDDKYIYNMIQYIINQLKKFDSLDNEPNYEKFRQLINNQLSSNVKLHIILPRFFRESFLYIEELEENIRNFKKSEMYKLMKEKKKIN